MNELPVVVLDPGHGGPQGSQNRGSSWNRARGPNGLLEKDVAYDLAQRVSARLRDTARVELTRDQNANPSLSERADVARRNNAAVFLSLHLNGSHDPSEDATDVYVAPEARGPSRAFAESIRQRVSLATGTTRGGLAARDIGTLVTSRHAPNTAACLAELAHLTNDRQARSLEDESYRDSLADALSDAIREHLQTATAETLGIGDGAKDAQTATEECWKRLETLRNNATKNDSENSKAAARLSAESSVIFPKNPYTSISKSDIEAVVRAANDTTTAPEILLALWELEGGTKAVTTATAVDGGKSPADAKSLFRSRVFYYDLGLARFVARVRSGDDPVLDDTATPQEHDKTFISHINELVAAKDLQQDLTGDINGELTVTSTGGKHFVTPKLRFYSLALILLDARWRHLRKRHFPPMLPKMSDGMNFVQWRVEHFEDFLLEAEERRKKAGKSLEEFVLHSPLTEPQPPTPPDRPAPGWKIDKLKRPRRDAIRFLHLVESYAPIFKDSMAKMRPGSTATTKGLDYDEDEAVAEQLAPTTFTHHKTFAAPATKIKLGFVFEDFDTSSAAHSRTRTIPAEVTTKAGILAEMPAFLEQPIAPGHILEIPQSLLLDAAPYFDFSGADAKVRLQSVLCHPSDPKDPDKLPGKGRFPIAVIVHGNVFPVRNITFSTSGPVPQLDGTQRSTATSLTITTLLESHRGFSENAPGASTGYLQEELAKHGFVSMSIDENCCNHLDLRIRTRAKLILEYLDDLRARIKTEATLKRFDGRIDFNRVVLIGHSRGGDAVVEAVDLNRARSKTKEPKRYGIKTVVSMSPSDFTGLLTSSTALKVSIAEAYYLVTYGSHDGDLMGEGSGSHGDTATGFRYYDRANTHRAMVFMHGATHNQFNRTWPDKDGFHRGADATDARILDRDKHETLAKEYVAGWLRYTVNKDWPQQLLFNGKTASATGAKVSLQWKFGKDLRTVEDSESGTDATNTMNGKVARSNVSEMHLNDDNPPDPDAPGFQRTMFPNDENLLKAVNVPKGRASVKEEVPAKFENVKDFTDLTFRVTKKYDITDEKGLPTAALPVFDITLTDAAGTSDTVLSATIQSENKMFPRPYFRKAFDPIANKTRNLTKCNLETWRVPLKLFAKVDRSRIRSVEFSFDAAVDQPVYVDTISFVKL